MTKDKLQDFLIEEAEYEESEVLAMSDYELLDSWLKWHGMIGWTDDIIDVIEAAYGLEIDR